MNFKNIFQKSKKSLFTAEMLDMMMMVNNAITRNIGNYITLDTISKDTEFVDQYEKLEILYAITKRQSNMACNYKWKLYQKNADGTKTEIEDHRILDTLKMPNPYTTKREWLNRMFIFYNTTGDVYNYGLPTIARIGDIPQGAITEIQCLPSQLMTVNVDSTFRAIPVSYEFSPPNYARITLNKDQVMHVKNARGSYKTDSDPQYGLSPLKPLMKDIQRIHGSKQAGVTMLENGGPRGIISQNPSAFTGDNHEGVISQDQAELLKEHLSKYYQGANSMNDIYVTAAALNWTEIGANAVDLQLIDNEKWSDKAVCRVLQMDPSLMGLTDKSALNDTERKEAEKSSYINGVTPFMEELTTYLNQWLVASYSDPRLCLVLDDSGIPALQDDLNKKATWVKSIEEWLTPNEVRAEFGKVPLDNVDSDTPIWEIRQIGAFNETTNNGNQ